MRGDVFIFILFIGDGSFIKEMFVIESEQDLWNLYRIVKLVYTCKRCYLSRRLPSFIYNGTKDFIIVYTRALLNKSHFLPQIHIIIKTLNPEFRKFSPRQTFPFDKGKGKPKNWIHYASREDRQCVAKTERQCRRRTRADKAKPARVDVIGHSEKWKL